MSHNTVFGGASREIEGGTTLIGGVAREIESGLVLVNGVAREIEFAKGMFTVTFAQKNAYTSVYYVTINGTQYGKGSASIEVEDGTTYEIRSTDRIYLNNTRVGTLNTSNYNYYYTGTIGANTTFTNNSGRIDITTS